MVDCVDISVNGEKEYKWCYVTNDCPDIECERSCDEYECMTNADRIRNMSDKELAILLQATECASHGWCDECQTLKGNPCNGLKDESNALVKEKLDWLREKVE